MKRVFCLLLCLSLLCGLLPTAVLADNDPPLYFELCGADGSAPETRVKSFDASFGEMYYFRAYTAETEGTQITGDGLLLSGAAEGELKWVSLDNSDGYYIWNTKLTKNNAPTFSAAVDGATYKIQPYVHSADVGWFSSQEKSLSTALTLGNETEADVFYDGKTPVTVYLAAEFSIVTEISENDIEASTGITHERTSRTYTSENETVNRGQGLTVTCPAGLSGEPSLTVTVKKRPWWEDNSNTVTYKVTFSADGVSAEDPSEGRPGEPVLLPGVTNGSGNQVYFGIGLLTDAGNYAVASSSRFTGPSTEETTEIFKPCFFVKSTEGYTETGLGSGQTVTVNKMSEPTCDDEEVTLPTDAWKENTDGTYSFTLTSKMEGTWTITASCTVGKTTYSVSCYSTRVNAEETTIEGENVKDVAAINSKLAEVINGNADTVKYCIVKLNSGTYEGTIEIPEEKTGRVIVILQGKRDSQGNLTILNGGIESNCDTVSVENIDFRGADYQIEDKNYTGNYSEKWTTGANAGKDNYALYGSGRGNSAYCSFEGYYRAVVWTVGSRLLGHNNIYRYNFIGWQIDITNDDAGVDTGLNTDATGTTFEYNNMAIHVNSFGYRQYTNDFAVYVRGNVFRDNICDVHSNSDRWWYIPGNYFEYNDNPGAVTAVMAGAKGGTSCYPMAKYDRQSGKIVEGSYTYQQLAESGDTLSNDLTATYLIPENALNDKVFHVSTATEDKKDEVLATFAFPETQTSTQARRAAPMRARAAARTVTGFDATVTVNRSNADSIVFTMCNPLKTVNVKLPCTFESGTVTHNGAEIKDAEFDGTNVTFASSERGDYVITKTGAEPAVPGASGSLIAGITAAGSGAGRSASASQFSDLASGSWYYEAVRSALKNGLMNGTSAHTFSPDMPMTRAMLVTILWRMAGQPSAKTSPFTDVVSGSWYAQAVNWAYDRGIVTGVSETAFAPNEPVTREALVTILYRYAALKQNLPAAEDGTGRFADGTQVSAFARDAVNWALQTGLLTGVSETKLSPKGLATRAQIAVLLERFLKL